MMRMSYHLILMPVPIVQSLRYVQVFTEQETVKDSKFKKDKITRKLQRFDFTARQILRASEPSMAGFGKDAGLI